jgi:hypothetical protein
VGLGIIIDKENFHHAADLFNALNVLETCTCLQVSCS